MSDVVFILGAGASRLCGGPLMADFLDIAADLLWAGEVEGSRKAFGMVFSVVGELQSVHSKAQLDLNNLESVFTALELGRTIQRFPGLERTEIPQAISALKELIVRTLEAKILFPAVNGKIGGVPAPYGEFAELLFRLPKISPPLSTSVITFNYDIAMDAALSYRGLGPDYSLGERSYAGSVPLLKLHGSLNWAAEKDSRTIRPLDVGTYLNGMRLGAEEERLVSVPIGSDLNKFFDPGKIECDPVIVPPTWNKADYHFTLSNVWAAAARHLSEASQIFIIGYSLPETDSFFRNLYALGCVGKSPFRRVAGFNPDNSDVTRGRFWSLLGPGAQARFKYYSMPFDKQAIDVIFQLLKGMRLE